MKTARFKVLKRPVLSSAHAKSMQHGSQFTEFTEFAADLLSFQTVNCDIKQIRENSYLRFSGR